MCIKLKEEMGIDNILKRERDLLNILWKKLSEIPNLYILASRHKNRLGIISFYIEGLHYHLAVRMLNDRFGIQCRGGCSCAGTYGHYLLSIDKQRSGEIADYIKLGDLSKKPGWIRISLHPVMTNEEVRFIGDSIAELAERHSEWSDRYIFDPASAFLASTNSPMDGDLKEMINRSFSEKFLRLSF